MIPKKGLLWTFISCLFLIGVSKAERGTVKIGGEFGMRSSYLYGQDDFSLKRPYAHVKAHFKNFGNDEVTQEVSISSRFLLDDEAPKSDTLTEATYKIVRENSTFTFGLQEIGWGETFGIYPLDFVNARNFEDPFISDLKWTRIPVFALNYEYLGEKFSGQLIAIPKPKNSIFPSKGDTFDTTPTSFAHLEREDMATPQLIYDSEIGGRLGYLFDFGLDVDFYYFYHRNRNLALDLKSPTTLTPVFKQIHSTGLSSTFATGDFVFLLDFVNHFNRPVNDPETLAVKYLNNMIGVFGFDFSTENKFQLGLQYHHDSFTEFYYNWISSQMSFPLFGDWMELSFFVFWGLNNQDLWYQPTMKLFMSDQLSMSIWADIIEKQEPKKAGQISSFSEHDRVFLDVSWQF
ncbi:MAG: hypothetical protein VXY34_02410 [Bdellovibrionota bacterium]|nr:hypothetical protein [Bdellovibrionota bacterium]